MKTALTAVAIALMAVSMASGNVRAYAIDPVRADWSGKADPRPDYGVSEIVTCCWDSLAYVELFAGDSGSTGSGYRVGVWEGNTELTYAAGVQHQPTSWVRFEDWHPSNIALTKGKQYEFRFTRSGNDSIEYYFSGGDPYPYGAMLVPGQGPTDADLACRVYGRMNPVSDVWRACVNHGDDPPGDDADTALAKAESIGIAWLREDFDQLWQWEDITAPAMGIYHRCENRFNLLGILCYGSDDTAKSSRSHEPSDTIYWPAQYPPRNLFKSVYSDSNWFARNCWSIMESMPKVKYWEVWPEANALWGMRNPDVAHYWGSGGPGDTINTPRERCSLYVRMCCIAESVAHALGGERKVIGGAVWRLVDAPSGGSAGVDWLKDMFELAENSYGGVESCFDIVSVHPYMHYFESIPGNDTLWFEEERFQRDLDTARWVVRQAGYPGLELWATEYGWPRWWKDQPSRCLTDTLLQARNVCQFYTSAIARQADPRGGYDRAIHYELTGHHVNWESTNNNEGFGLLDTSLSQPLLPNGWGFTQLGSVLDGKRLNGRVMTGDTLTDPLVRMYEFEDPATSRKTWVCWQNGGGGQDAGVQLPARSDSAYIEMLAYKGGTPPNDMRQANSYGWLGIGAGDRPQFVTEPASMPISRPDLIVDSVMVPVGAHVWSVMDIHAIVKNIGNVITPDTVALDFLCDDSVFRHAASEWPIDSGHTYDFSFEINPIPGWMHGWHLFSARVNSGQTYVEKDGMDDNAGYVRRYISYGPGGDLIGELYGSHSNAPLPLLRLESHSYEADTLGSVPAESARLVQWWYGINDTVVHGGDTTAWFCASETVSLDTSWLYLSEQGKYKMFLQVKDSWSMSDLIPDTTYPFVVFDTTGPTGSIVINGGARFAPSSTCTIALAAFDSASGVGWMRFMNRPRVDLVSNGGFLATAGSWGFADGAYDTSLQMANLSAGPPQAWVRQFVPAESISAYSGDSCVLEASILARVHDGDATGDVSFWYWSTRQDTSQHDTLWELGDSASYSGDLLSLTGRYNLSARFLLETPTPESGWVWRGGMVRVQAHGVDGGVGSVWTDNVALNAFEPQSGCAWWGAYDTLAEWNIDATAGRQVVQALYLDSAGNESRAPFADTVILDPTAPVVRISVPDPRTIVNGTLEVTGWAYDPVEVEGDTWFQSRHLSYRHVDSTNWLPVGPDSVSHEPAYPDSQSVLGMPVHLGYWNTAALEDAAYYLLLTGTDSAGHVSTCTTWVLVSNEGGGGGEAGGPEGGGSGLGEGSVYVGSATGTVLHLSDDLDSLDCFQVTDSGSQACVTAILEVGSDSLLVLDAYGKRIHKLHKGGQGRRRLVSNLSQPSGLTRDENGNFWLVDKGIHRIGKFRSNGTLVIIRGGLGADSLHFHSPEGIAVKGGLVYVADTKNDRIAVWDTSGNYRATITGDFENPTAVLVTDSGTIYLTDDNDGKLKGITPLGGNIVAIGTADSTKLKGLVLSENRHYLFSIAAQPNKVYKLRIRSDDSTPGGQQSAGKFNLPKTLSLAQPFPNPARTRLNIAYALPHQTRVVLKLYDVAGKLVTTFANGEQKPGYYYLTWNRQDAKGRSCACGVYFCTLAAENQRFSRKVILTE